MASALTPEVPFGGIFLSFLAYHALYCVADKILRCVNPAFYQRLKTDGKRSLEPLLLSTVGFCFLFVSTPACLVAFATSSAESDTFINTSPFRTIDKVCIVSKSITWMAELPLIVSMEYIIHHYFCISSMLFILYMQAPRRPLYLIYASLAVETINRIRNVSIRLWGNGQRDSAIIRWLLVAVAWTNLFIKVPVGFYLTYLVYQCPTQFASTMYASSMLFYTIYTVDMALKQFKVAGVLKVSYEWPAHVLVLGKCKTTLFSILLGVALITAETSTILIYGLNVEDIFSRRQISVMAVEALFGATLGLLGARCISMVMPSTLPVRDMWKRDLYIQTGLMFSGLWVVLSPSMGYFVDRHKTMAAMAISVPLGETFTRFGCYFSCYDESSGDMKRDLKNVQHRRGISTAKSSQLQASVLNFCSFFIVIMGMATHCLDLYSAAAIAVAVHAAIRLLMEVDRKEKQAWLVFGRKAARPSLMALLASCQLLLAVYILLRVNESTNDYLMEVGSARRMLSSYHTPAWTLVIILAVVLLRFLVLGAQHLLSKAVGSSICRTVLFSSPGLAIVGLCVHMYATQSWKNDVVSDTSCSGVGFANFRILVSSPVYFACAFGIAFMPVALLRAWDG